MKKENKEITNKKNPKPKKGLIAFLIILLLVLGAGFSYYFFFFSAEADKKEDILISEEEATEWKKEIGGLMDSFLGQVKQASINDTGDISPYVTLAGKNDLQKNLFPDGWTDLTGTKINSAEIKSPAEAEVEIIFPLLSDYGDKFMTSRYKVVRESGRWLVAEVLSRIITDHGITVWPVTQLNEDLVKLQDKIGENRQAWQLDPLAVAKKFAVQNGFFEKDRLTLEGEVYNWRPEKGTYESIIKAVRGGHTFYFLMTQPLRKGYWGIWVIERISRERPDF